MNIGHTLPHSLSDDTVYQPDDGCIICAVEQVVSTWQHVRQEIAVIIADRPGHRCSAAVHRVMIGQIAVKGLVIYHFDVEGHRQITSHLKQHERISTLSHGNY